MRTLWEIRHLIDDPNYAGRAGLILEKPGCRGGDHPDERAMIRHVADRKAILAGVAGAVAWEIVARLLIFAGMPFFSIVETLVAGAAERECVGISWSVGMLLHLIVGSIWTVSTLLFLVGLAAPPRAPGSGVRVRAGASGVLHQAPATRTDAAQAGWRSAGHGPIRPEWRALSTADGRMRAPDLGSGARDASYVAGRLRSGTTEMQRLGIVPIMGLCHFGLPDWLQNLQIPKVPHALADYARAFARRYPWVRLYILVNEMYVFAKPSALDGLWNEQCRDERARSPATCSGRVKGRDTASVIIFQIDVPGEHPVARQRRCEPRRGPSTRV